MEFGDSIEERVHAVEHGDDGHGRDAAADLGERHHVRKQDRHALKHLARVHRVLALAQPIRTPDPSSTTTTATKTNEETSSQTSKNRIKPCPHRMRIPSSRAQPAPFHFKSLNPVHFLL